MGEGQGILGFRPPGFQEGGLHQSPPVSFQHTSTSSGVHVLCICLLHPSYLCSRHPLLWSLGLVVKCTTSPVLPAQLFLCTFGFYPRHKEQADIPLYTGQTAPCLLLPTASYHTNGLYRSSDGLPAIPLLSLPTVMD